MEGIAIEYVSEETTGGIKSFLAKFTIGTRFFRSSSFYSSPQVQAAIEKSQLPRGEFLGIMRLVVLPTGLGKLTLFPFGEVSKENMAFFKKKGIGAALENIFLTRATKKFGKKLTTITVSGTTNPETLTLLRRRGWENPQEAIAITTYLSLLREKIMHDHFAYSTKKGEHLPRNRRPFIPWFRRTGRRTKK